MHRDIDPRSLGFRRFCRGACVLSPCNTYVEQTVLGSALEAGSAVRNNFSKLVLAAISHC